MRPLRPLPRLLAVACVAALTACAQTIDAGDDLPADDDDAADEPLPVSDDGAAGDGAADDDAPGGDDDAPPPADADVDDDDDAPPPDDDDAPPPDGPDAGPGGSADAGVGPSTGGSGNDPEPPPAQTTQACVEWTDCGPWYVNENSGFDCVQDQCVCDATGEWSDSCTSQGAVWSQDDCFCYWGTTALPSTAADPDPDDDVYCWWTWWDRECEPDQWVDTSYYQKVCYDDDECYWDYVERGYWADGECEDVWVVKCDDGTIWKY